MSFLPIMSEFLEETSHTVTIEERIQQMDKFQDQTYSGTGIDVKSEKSFKYAMITDGHGINDCINVLRGISKDNMSTILGEEDPVSALAEYVKKEVKTDRLSGSTMSLVKIFDDYIDCFNCGDSQMAVFKDGNLIYLSKEHNCKNKEEKERLLAMNPLIKFEYLNSFKLIGESKMVGSYCEYVVWPDGKRLACTQALGNQMRTGYAPECMTILIESGSTYKVLIGSDGLWDMVMKDRTEEILRFSAMNADEAMAFVKNRWLQEWEMADYEDSTEFYRAKYKTWDCDDISLVMVDIIPN